VQHPVIKTVFVYLRLLRIHHWSKNVFIFVGLLFSQEWDNYALINSVLLAFAAFSLAASATYVLNDYIDRDSDKLHPGKSRRPLADGSANPKIALSIAVVLALTAVVIAAGVSTALLLIISGYLLLFLAYSAWLKHVPILDVCTISMGFVLRLLAGTEGVGIEPSNWLFLCGIMITLFLGFTKRRAELIVLDDNAIRHRRVLNKYPDGLLDHLVSICAGAAIVTYGLYTTNPAVLEMHGTERLAYSVPFAIYGVFRYLYLLFWNQCKGDLVEDTLRDFHLVLSGLGWCVVVVWALM